MTIIEKREVVERTVSRFVANDGTEFEDYVECRDYERQLFCDKLETIEQKKSANGHPNLNMVRHTTSDYIWVRPHVQKDLDIINGCMPTLGKATENDLHQWLCLEFTTNDKCIMTRLSEGIDYVKRILGKFGCDVTISNKAEESTENTIKKGE